MHTRLERPLLDPTFLMSLYLSEVELEAGANEMAGSVREIHSICPRLKELAEVLKFGLGAGDPVEPPGIQGSFVDLLNALGHDDGDAAIGRLQVLVEVDSKCVHLPGQPL